MRKELSDIFRPGESPYIGMFTAGRIGYELSEVMQYCTSLGLPIREKDVVNWSNGARECELYSTGFQPAGMIVANSYYTERYEAFTSSKLEDFAEFPKDWIGSKRRFFPCSQDNRPLARWGWSEDYIPKLYTQRQARELSPCGWVGQNLMYQKFIVIDIDGVGHGVRDEETISFGNQFRNQTLVYEDPAKIGSFHIYLATNRIIPVKHFPWAKIDLMGNASNAAVYMKNKRGNGKPIAELNEQHWKALIDYQLARKERLQ